jgi:hypothetical protein
MYLHVQMIIVNGIFNKEKQQPHKFTERTLRIAKQMRVNDDGLAWLCQSKFVCVLIFCSAPV